MIKLRTPADQSEKSIHSDHGVIYVYIFSSAEEVMAILRHRHIKNRTSILIMVWIILRFMKGNLFFVFQDFFPFQTSYLTTMQKKTNWSSVPCILYIPDLLLVGHISVYSVGYSSVL